MAQKTLVCALTLLIAISCSKPKPVVVVAPLPAPEPPNVVVPPRPEKITLVLSVGGSRGLAHIGAIDALKKRGVRIDSIFGNSMGAVIGGLYVTAPESDLTSRYRMLIAAFQRITEKSMPLYRKVAIWLRLTVPEFGNREFESAMREVFGGAVIENLPVKFATSYKVREGSGIRDVSRISGDLAEAVARSANNPFVFKNSELTYIDPGMDRMSAVPVEDAFRVFHPDRILAVNVTGDPMFYSGNVACAIEELKLEIPQFNAGEELSGAGKTFDMLYRIGFDRMTSFLESGFPHSTAAAGR